MASNVTYDKNVIYAGEVIYDAHSNLAYFGPRGAQRRRSSGTRGCALSPMIKNVI
jgi:hypothetical protein